MAQQKENNDLFSQAQPLKDETLSLPLDFAGRAGTSDKKENDSSFDLPLEDIPEKVEKADPVHASTPPVHHRRERVRHEKKIELAPEKPVPQEKTPEEKPLHVEEVKIEKTVAVEPKVEKPVVIPIAPAAIEVKKAEQSVPIHADKPVTIPPIHLPAQKAVPAPVQDSEKKHDELKKITFPPLDDEEEQEKEDEDSPKEEEKKPVVLETKYLKKTKHEKPLHVVHSAPENEKPATHRKVEKHETMKASAAAQASSSDQHVVYEKVYKSVTEVRPSGRKTTDPKKELEQKKETVSKVPSAKREQEPETKDDIEISKSKKGSVVEKFSQDNISSGQILQEGRVRSGMSIDQVAIATKIKKSFVEALERDDFSELPATVYVNAYAKALCRLYKIDEKKVFGLLNRVKGRELEYTVPEEIIQHIEKGKQINIDQKLKVRRLGITISIACIVVVLCVIAGMQIFGMKRTPSQKPAAQIPVQPAQSYQFISEEIEKKLNPTQNFSMTELILPD